jgi:hypothetical protein
VICNVTCDVICKSTTALCCAALLCVGCDSADSKRPADAGPTDGGPTNASPTQDGPAQGRRAPWFTEEAELRGLNFDHHSGSLGRHRLPEIIGGGVALADFDGDGDLDAYLVQSGDLATTDAGAIAKNRLYINRGDGYFDEAPEAHGAADGGYGMGAAAGDYDGDGDVDLYVTNVGLNVLLRNDGHGFFEDVSAIAGVDDPGWGTAATFIDLDSDGDLDLFIVNYLNWSEAVEMTCYARGVRAYCPPQAYNLPAADRLYRNNGDGTFTDVSETAGLNQAFGNGLGLVVGDFDSDGRTDLFVANDMTVNQLWLNQGALRFKDEAMLRGVALDENGVAKSGMGVVMEDVDDDGDPDLLIVNLQGQTDSFFRNEGTHFLDDTAGIGLGTRSRKYTRWGVALADFNNDGRLDLYQANGRLNRGQPKYGDAYAEPNTLYQGTPEGHFVEVRPTGGTIESLHHNSRGLAIGDVDNDGGLDLLVVNRDGPAYLLINQVADEGNWVRFRLLTAQGQEAYGASVDATIATRRVTRYSQTAGSYLASNDPRVHFGLSTETTARDITVHWSDGYLEAFGDAQAGNTISLRRGTGTALN